MKQSSEQTTTSKKTPTLSEPTALGTQVNYDKLGYDPSDVQTIEMERDEKTNPNGALAALQTVWGQTRDIGKGLVAKLQGNYKTYGNSKADFKRFIQEYRKSLFTIMGLVVAVLVVIAVAVWYVQNDNKYTLESGGVQYYVGQAYPIEAGAVLTRALDDTTVLTTSTGETTVDSLLIYKEDTGSIILPQDMVYYDPRNTSFSRIDALSEIFYQPTAITAVTGSKETQLNRGFLYDGDDYYVFLEPVTVTYNGYETQLSALSYIEAIYETHVMIFDYETKETILQEVTTEIVVTTELEEYTLKLITGVLEYYNGDKTLLFTRPDLLDDIFA